MDEFIVGIIWVEDKLVGAGTEIAFLTEKCLTVWIQKYPYPDVEFSLGNEEGSLDVLLENEAIVFEFWANGAGGIAWFSRWYLLLLRLLLLIYSQPKSILFGRLRGPSLESG